MNASGTPKEHFKHSTNSLRTFQDLSKNFLHTLRTLQSFLSKYSPRTLQKLPKNTVPILEELSKTRRPSQNSPRIPNKHSSNPLRIFFELNSLRKFYNLPTSSPCTTNASLIRHTVHSQSATDHQKEPSLAGWSTAMQQDRRYAAEAAPTNPPRK